MYVRFYLIADPMLTKIDNRIIPGGVLTGIWYIWYHVNTSVEGGVSR